MVNKGLQLLSYTSISFAIYFFMGSFIYYSTLVECKCIWNDIGLDIVFLIAFMFSYFTFLLMRYFLANDNEWAFVYWMASILIGTVFCMFLVIMSGSMIQSIEPRGNGLVFY